jgi:hypothetical protein
MSDAVSRSAPPRSRDPFRGSLLGRPFWVRLAGVAGVLVLLWLAIAWAVSVP